jgi:hypothetical protein
MINHQLKYYYHSCTSEVYKRLNRFTLRISKNVYKLHFEEFQKDSKELSLLFAEFKKKNQKVQVI